MDKDTPKIRTKKKLLITTKIFMFLSLTLCVCALLFFTALKICHGILPVSNTIKVHHPFIANIAILSYLIGLMCYFAWFIFFLVSLTRSFSSGAILRNLLVTLAGIIIAFFPAGFFMKTLRNHGPPLLRPSLNIIRVYDAIHKYSEKHDGFLPQLSQLYIKLKESDPNHFYRLLYRSDIPQLGYSEVQLINYGVNLNLEGRRLKEIPPDVIFIFETTPFEYTTPYKNNLSSEYHNGKGCIVLYGDLHLDFIKTKDFNSVRWQP